MWVQKPNCLGQSSVLQRKDWKIICVNNIVILSQKQYVLGQLPMVLINHVFKAWWLNEPMGIANKLCGMTDEEYCWKNKEDLYMMHLKVITTGCQISDSCNEYWHIGHNEDYFIITCVVNMHFNAHLKHLH
jgi:hypothetical protein